MAFVTSKYSEKVKRKAQCTLCPHMCMLKEGNKGLCGVRGNAGGRIVSFNYGYTSSIAIDPIEKKPLYHFFPGNKILSIGSFGCNLRCNFCQNWQISQNSMINKDSDKTISINEIIEKVVRIDNIVGVAYTYNEPTVWYEFMLDIAKEIKNKGLYNVMVSNGYIKENPLIELIEYIDAFNIDLKAFTNGFYREMAKGELSPVLDTIKTIKAHNKHIEITNLIVPGKNDNPDDFRNMIKWIVNEVGEDTVLHLSKYFPRYKQVVSPTSIEKLEDLADIAREVLNYVYIGNVENENTTFCNKCGAELISRNRYQISFLADYNKGMCLKCNTKVIKHVY